MNVGPGNSSKVSAGGNPNLPQPPKGFDAVWEIASQVFSAITRGSYAVGKALVKMVITRTPPWKLADTTGRTNDVAQTGITRSKPQSDADQQFIREICLATGTDDEKLAKAVFEPLASQFDEKQKDEVKRLLERAFMDPKKNKNDVLGLVQQMSANKTGKAAFDAVQTALTQTGRTQASRVSSGTVWRPIGQERVSVDFRSVNSGRQVAHRTQVDCPAINNRPAHLRAGDAIGEFDKPRAGHDLSTMTTLGRLRGQEKIALGQMSVNVVVADTYISRDQPREMPSQNVSQELCNAINEVHQTHGPAAFKLFLEKNRGEVSSGIEPIPRRLLIPIALDVGAVGASRANHLCGLAVEIDREGKAQVLFFDPLGPSGHYFNAAKPFIDAVNAVFVSVPVYRTNGSYEDDATTCGDWTLWFLLEHAATCESYEELSQNPPAKIIIMERRRDDLACLARHANAR